MRPEFECIVGGVSKHPFRRNQSHSASKIIEWLSSDECHELDEAGLISGLGDRLCVMGLPIGRITLHLMTLHPEYVGKSVAWAPSGEVQVQDRAHGTVSLAFLDSALATAMKTRKSVVVGLTGPGASWQCIDVFEGRGLNQLLVAPLCNVDGPISVASFGTACLDGFTETERRLLERLTPALRNACELLTLRHLGNGMLDTYIGPFTAQRIKAGRIRLGEVESIDAALLLCDLRGFTELSNRLPANEVMRFLNRYFDSVVPPISRRGGEVAKFIGDAVLAFFPGYSAAWATGAAYDAAREILAEIKKELGPDVNAGIALHYGSIAYGNIGSGGRLDFTLIGPNVNLVSRIQHVCSEEGRELLMSSAFVEAERGALTRRLVGGRPLKGFDHELTLFSD